MDSTSLANYFPQTLHLDSGEARSRLEKVHLYSHGINQPLYGYLQWLSDSDYTWGEHQQTPWVLNGLAHSAIQWPLWPMHVSSQLLTGSWCRYQARVGGPLAYLEHTHESMAWVDRDPRTIIKQLGQSLAPLGLHLQNDLAQTATTLRHPQHWQGSMAQLWQRLCQQQGWYYQLLPQTPATLWLGDKLSASILPESLQQLTLKYRPEQNAQPSDATLGYITHITSRHRLAPQSSQSHDFDLTQQQPTSATRVDHSSGWGAQHYVMDQLSSAGFDTVQRGFWQDQQQQWLITAHSLSLVPGQKLTIDDQPDSLSDTDYWRVLQVSYECQQLPEAGSQAVYRQRALIVPYTQTTYPTQAKVDQPQSDDSSRLWRSGVIDKPVDYHDASYHQLRDHAADEHGCYQVHYPEGPAQDNAHNAKQQHHRRLPAVQPFTGPVTDQQPSGWHFGLKVGTQVVTAMNGAQHNRALISGALSNPFHTNPVTQKQPSDYRLQTAGGHAFMMRDTTDERQLVWRSHNNQQYLSLHHKPHKQLIEQHNKQGSWQTESKTDTTWHIGQDHYLTVNNQHHIQTPLMSILGQGDWQAIIERKLTIQAHNIAHQYHRLNSQIGQGHIDIKSGQSVSKRHQTWQLKQAQLQAQQVTVPGPCIQLGGVTLSGSSISGAITVQASGITWYKPTGGGSMGSQSTDVDQDQAKPSHHKADQMADLFAVNLRPDQPPDLYHDESKKRDPYSNQLPQQALQYFQQNGQNVTVFVHGYNVPYGQFGGDIIVPVAYSRDPQQETIIQVDHLSEVGFWYGIKLKQAKLKASHQWLQHSIYNRRDVYRDLEQFKQHIPKSAVKMPDGSIVAPSHESLNGTGAHNWWLHMEYNLNYATGQLDTETFKNYTRLLHIAWAGDPTQPFDYMASVEQSQKAGNKLAPILQQLQQAGLKVNVIAHSLGNAVVLKALDKLGQQGIQLNHVFLWEPAVPNDCLANSATNNNLCGLYHYPKAAQGTDQMTVLYSQHDNVLGPPHSNVISQQWEKVQDNNSPSVNDLLESIIHVVDDLLPESDRLKSFYHLANLISQSLTPWLQNIKQCKQFYHNTWLNHYRTARYHTYGQRRLEPTLAKQCWVIDYLYSAPLNAVAALIRSIQSVATDNTNHRQILISLDAIDKLKQDLKNNDRPYADPKTRAKHLRRWQRNQVAITQRGHDTTYTIIDWRKKPIKDKMKKHLHQLLRRHHQQFQQSLEYGMHGGVVISNRHKTVSGIYDQAELIAAFIITALLTEGTDVKPALGYNGADSKTQDQLGDKLIPVDQKGILTSHSAMKDPSEAMMNKIYKHYIWGKKGIKQLGLIKWHNSKEN